MQAFVLALCGIVTSFGYLKKCGYLPDAAPFLMEVLSIVALVYVVARGVQTGFRHVRPAYWLVFAAVLLTMMAGVLANGVGAGPVVSGMRYYVRAIPFFLLPAVCHFSDRQVSTQLKFLLLVAVLQLPLAVSQRLDNLAMAGSTGDTTQGSLLNSAILSIFLICAVVVLLAFFLRGLVRIRTLVLLFLVFVVPTTLNETKGTLVLLPIGIFVAFFAGAKPGARLKAVILAAAAFAVFLALFIPIYDHLIQTKTYGTSVSDFFTSDNRAESYLYSGAGVGDTDDVKRVDAIVVPLRYLAQDPVLLAFGVGAGNASRSQLGPGFSGEYYATLGPFTGTAFSFVITELGIAGLLLAMLLHWCIFMDARAVASTSNGVLGGLSLGWCGVVAVVTIGYFYKNLIVYDSISTLFWYLSGLIAAERMRQQTSRMGADSALGLRREEARPADDAAAQSLNRSVT